MINWVYRLYEWLTAKDAAEPKPPATPVSKAVDRAGDRIFK